MNEEEEEEEEPEENENKAAGPPSLEHDDEGILIVDKQVDSNDVSLIQVELDDALIDKLEESEPGDEGLMFDALHSLEDDTSEKSESQSEVEAKIAHN